MKLSHLKIDSKAIEDGEWHKKLPGMGDFAVKVRGLGSKKYQALLAEMVANVPQKDRVDGLSDADNFRITNEALAQEVILDWSGLENDDGSLIEHDPRIALKILSDPDCDDIRQAILTAATRTGRTARLAAISAGNV